MEVLTSRIRVKSQPLAADVSHAVVLVNGGTQVAPSWRGRTRSRFHRVAAAAPLAARQELCGRWLRDDMPSLVAFFNDKAGSYVWHFWDVVQVGRVYVGEWQQTASTHFLARDRCGCWREHATGVQLVVARAPVTLALKWRRGQ